MAQSISSVPTPPLQEFVVYSSSCRSLPTNAWGVSARLEVRPRANGRNIVRQQLPTFLDVTCYTVRPFAHLVACCWMLLRVVKPSLKPVKLFSQQLPIAEA